MAMGEGTRPEYEYTVKTSHSKAWIEQAKQVMPGGVTANIKHFAPYPLVMKKGKGAFITDVDDRQYVDYLLAYGALMLGHGHPEMKQAIDELLADAGTFLFGAPHPLEVTFGQEIQRLYPSIERLRYTNSGTEATLLAVRLAKAYTNKTRLAKFEGHYHGGYNDVLYSVNPPLSEAGPADVPCAVQESMGIQEKEREAPLILPFNNLAACERLLREHQASLAAVIIEPLQGGFIPATPGFITGLRNITKKLGILLIFDEVKTGFRITLGGAEEWYQVKPDLTTLGKVIGGGFPFGITGGRKEIMELTSPAAGADLFEQSGSRFSRAKDVVFHSGTYNGHPLILAAGLKTIEVLQREIDSVFAVTDTLKQELEALFKRKGVPMKAVGTGSIFNVVLTEHDILNYRDLQASDLAIRKMIDLLLLNEGIYTKPLNRYSLSTAHTEREVERTIAAYDRVLSRLVGG
ncbi:aspartate aminotransferase family protein [Alkalihalobacillus oceani]|uniref:Aspartate aminotransferase family protein n=1 Tax=Halalkalibacter oceani TaxID=1653776 RepID=A0A9X2DRW5_9BACI|nr:aspartate aminotransferase family protein [Halalkalibacter oceani]MCM3715292.1 aspartate aminotransferase family protein [Halalkalibacter oceani]